MAPLGRYTPLILFHAESDTACGFCSWKILTCPPPEGRNTCFRYVAAIALIAIRTTKEPTGKDAGDQTRGGMAAI